MHLELQNYDNHYDIIDIIRSNSWIRYLNLDVFFSSGALHRRTEYKAPLNEDTGERIISVSRIEKLNLYLGVKNEKSRSDLVSAFAPNLVGEMKCLKELKIMAFIDDEEWSQRLIQNIPNVTNLTFRFVSNEPTISYFLE